MGPSRYMFLSGARRLRDVGSPSERDPSAGEGVASRPRCRRGQVVRVRRLLQRDVVGATPGDDGGKEDLPRLELQHPRGSRDGNEQGGPGGRDACPHLLLHRVDPVPPQFPASDREVLPDRHVAREDEPRLHPVRGPRGRPRAVDDEPPAIARRRRRRDALHGGHGPRGPRPPHARLPGRRVVASVRPTPGGGGRPMMQSPPKTIAPRAKTGIPVLDDRLQGGFPRPSTLLLFSEKPTEKRLFGENFVIQGAKAGEICLYVDFFRAPQLARGELKRFGSVDPAKLVLVDATSSQLLLPSHEKYHIDDIDNLANIREAIVAAMAAEHPGRIVVDSMEFLMDRFPKEDVLRLWRELIEAARSAGTVICFLFINWTLMERELDEIRAMSDFVVEFQSSLRGGIIRNSMRISQMESNGIRTNWIPYTFKDLVGLTVYFPRILVTGPFNAGKSTVVKALAEKSISIDRMGTTVAFDYGNVNITGIEAEIFGTPGQERFEFIFKIFAREVSGVLLVVDAARRLQGILTELRRLPAVLGATIARRDGILIAHALPKTMDPKKIAAMAAAIVGTSEMAVVEMGLGSFNSSIVDTQIGKMIATGAGEAAIVGTSEMATIQLAQGRFVRAIIESDEGKLLSLGAGEEALLVALVYDDANLGLVLLAMERAAKQVETILRDGAG